MGIGGSIAIFFVIWWIGLFAILPWGIRSQWETGEVVEGSDPGAPAQPRLLKIVLVNTVFAAVIFTVFYYVYTNHLLTLDMVPFLPFGPDGR
jgi:predicted secreted protein